MYRVLGQFMYWYVPPVTEVRLNKRLIVNCFKSRKEVRKRKASRRYLAGTEGELSATLLKERKSMLL